MSRDADIRDEREDLVAGVLQACPRFIHHAGDGEHAASPCRRKADQAAPDRSAPGHSRLAAAAPITIAFRSSRGATWKSPPRTTGSPSGKNSRLARPARARSASGRHPRRPDRRGGRPRRNSHRYFPAARSRRPRVPPRTDLQVPEAVFARLINRAIARIGIETDVHDAIGIDRQRHLPRSSRISRIRRPCRAAAAG